MCDISALFFVVHSIDFFVQMMYIVGDDFFDEIFFAVHMNIRKIAKEEILKSVLGFEQ